MTLVIDASTLVATLVDTGPDGRWAEGVLTGAALAAPQLLHIEVASVLRRAELSDGLSSDSAALAHRDLLGFRIELFGYQPLAERVWELRTTVSAYDAWYVALAEELDAPLATLDQRLTRANGPRCHFEVPPAQRA